eukprot:CAMPEP_0179857556 /NCGR_PEP_ID=MMETSP0982-20121206/11824_1 /TAXON_ID=483367 /ORGANISM="non described non described, Strain CCMP 2436" /LENGTH=44 /DNA_ID= /DNA_START= /DNA_END= /DNA_ORIENTATION=
MGHLFDESTAGEGVCLDAPVEPAVRLLIRCADVAEASRVLAADS